MIYLILASFFYSSVIYRFPVGHYGYLLASDVAAIAFVAAFIVRLAVSKEHRYSSGAYLGKILASLTILMTLGLIHIYFSADRLFSELGRGVADTLRFIEFAALYLAIAHTPYKKETVLRALSWVFLLGLAATVFGLVSDCLLHVQRTYAGIDGDVLRVQGEMSAFFTHSRACTGLFLLVCFCLGLGLVLNERRTPVKLLLAVAACLILVAVILTGSRAAILGTLVAILTSLVLCLRYEHFRATAASYVLLLLIVAGVGGAIAFTTSSVSERIKAAFLTTTRSEDGSVSRHEIGFGAGYNPPPTEQDRSVTSRFENWHVTSAQIFKSCWVFFFGFGVQQQMYLSGGFGGAHDNFLQYLVDLGIVGLGLFAAMLASTWNIFRGGIKYGTYKEQCLHLAMLCCLAGLIVTCITQETFYMQHSLGNFFGFWLALVALFQNLQSYEDA
ncbi:MAG: O-antigen ligase family protein [Pseudomonadota bacterium]